MAGFFGFSLPVRPLRVKQGEHREWSFVRHRRNPETGVLEPDDITDAVIEAQVRDRNGTLLATFNTFVTDGESGAFSLVLSSAQTAAIPAGLSANSLCSRHLWDGFITKPGDNRVAFVALSPFVIEPAATLAP